MNCRECGCPQYQPQTSLFCICSHSPNSHGVQAVQSSHPNRNFDQSPQFSPNNFPNQTNYHTHENFILNQTQRTYHQRPSCKQCGKEAWFDPTKKDYSDYCSRSCAREGTPSRTPVSFGKSGESIPFCIQCEKERCLIFPENGHLALYCSERCRGNREWFAKPTTSAKNHCSYMMQDPNRPCYHVKRTREKGRKKKY